MTQEIAVIAIANARPGADGRVEAAIRPCIPETRKEPGCLAYAVHRDPEQPGRFVFIERWTSRDALELHKATPHFLAMMRGLEADLNSPFVVDILTELA